LKINSYHGFSVVKISSCAKAHTAVTITKQGKTKQQQQQQYCVTWKLQ